MASIITLVRLLLLLLPVPLRKHLWPASHQAEDLAGAGELLHPIFMVPGVSCSDLEARLTEAYQPSIPSCGALKAKGWFGLYENSSDISEHHYHKCFEEQMSLVYDPIRNEYRNLASVETRVPYFGIVKGYHQKNPLGPKWCLTRLIEALEEMGYRDGDTMLGAPYDFRYAAPIPGQTSQFYSHYFKELMELVEATSEKHHKKVIIFGHSLGGMVILEFIRSTPLAWRDKYIKHLILVAPTLSTGFLSSVIYLASGPQGDLLYVPKATALSLRPMWRSFETSIINIPSTKAYGHKPIVITKQRNYSAYDMEDLLTDIGFEHAIEPFRRRVMPKMNYFKAPMVP
uniref:Serine aminopeptidase S33 domain-containing protein n=1 Tax=Leersia perrieri TaxID=77586 RepID=A0A0D9VHP8_9ORYZ